MSIPSGKQLGVFDSNLDESEQVRAFRSGDVPVAVFGLGKLGLPVAAVFAHTTGNTIGVDVDESVVDIIRSGGCHVKREPGLPELVETMVETGALTPSSDPSRAAAAATVHVIVVPTLLTEENEPDLTALTSVVRDIGTSLAPRDLVLVESTVPPGTAAEHIVPLLSAESGLDPGSFGVTVCPERTVSGQALADIRGTHPKVVGGVDTESTRAAELIYGEITDNSVLAVSDAATASAVKVFEGVYRDVNIGLANQLAILTDEIAVDVNEAIGIANTQPFCDIHDPGPGVGGHCIPVYPYFLIGKVDTETPLLETTRSLNDWMPSWTVERISHILDSQGVRVSEAKILLLGITYKANVEELRHSPALEIARDLRGLDADVLGSDPLVDRWNEIEDIVPVPVAELNQIEVDLVVLLTPHDEFSRLDWEGFGAPILDSRRAIDSASGAVDIYTLGGRIP